MEVKVEKVAIFITCKICSNVFHVGRLEYMSKCKLTFSVFNRLTAHTSAGCPAATPCQRAPL